jgi:hypothetical protein
MAAGQKKIFPVQKTSAKNSAPQDFLRAQENLLRGKNSFHLGMEKIADSNYSITFGTA